MVYCVHLRQVCKNCEPPVQYVRDFDVTTKTARHRHKTERTCQCGAALHDTIVLPGETGKLEWPLNWTAALQHAERASHIVVLGSSLRVRCCVPVLVTKCKGNIELHMLHVPVSLPAITLTLEHSLSLFNQLLLMGAPLVLPVP